MEFRTRVDTSSNKLKISLSDHILLIGSCFAEHMGQRFSNYKFSCIINPYGVLYNPASIQLAIEVLLNRAEKGTPFPEEYLFCHKGYWNSWLHAGIFGASNRQECMERIERHIDQAAQTLSKARFLILTFGTNRRYVLKDTGLTVGNCHKQPAKIFYTVDDTPADITRSYRLLLKRLFRLNPHLTVLFTVSPYRYAKYGFHGNQLSKAALLLAIDALIKNKMPDCVQSECFYFEPEAHLIYFPAYEIILDELRDYRFYAEDMLHPSEQAVQYVWERFSETFFAEREQHFLNTWDSIQKDLSHRPFHPDSPEYKDFLHKIVLKLERVKENYPNLAVEKEITEIKNRIKQIN